MSSYNLFSLHQQSLENFNNSLLLTQKLLNNPLNPLSYLPQTQNFTAYLKIVTNSQISYQKPNFDFLTNDIYEEDICRNDFCTLKKFTIKNNPKKINTSPAKKTNPTKYLIISPLSGNYSAIFSSFIENLLFQKAKQGLPSEVYITDWHNIRDVPNSAGDFGFLQNLEIVEEYIKKSGAENLISYSQSGYPLIVALSRLDSKSAAKIKTATFLGVPFDTRINAIVDPDALSLPDTVKANFLEIPPGYLGEGRMVLPGALQYLAFIQHNISRYVNRHIKFINQTISGDKNFISTSAKFKKNLHNVMDLSALHISETIEMVYSKHLLIEDKLNVKGKKIKLSNIKNIKILLIEGDYDNLCPIGQTIAIADKLTNIKTKEYLKVPCGHFGLIIGSKFEEYVLPKIIEFTKEK